MAQNDNRYTPGAFDGSDIRNSVDGANKKVYSKWPTDHILSRILAFVEYYVIYLLGAFFGISTIVRYLRNPNPAVAVKLLRAFGATVGDYTTIKGSVLLDNIMGDKNSNGDLSHLQIGANCYIGDSVFFDLANVIVIEDNVVVAGRASFITHAECKRSPYLSQKYPRQCERVVVRTGAWVGFGATVLLGVTVGSNAALGAHSLLLQDAEPQSVYIGAPARKLKRI